MVWIAKIIRGNDRRLIELDIYEQILDISSVLDKVLSEQRLKNRQCEKNTYRQAKEDIYVLKMNTVTTNT